MKTTKKKVFFFQFYQPVVQNAIFSFGQQPQRNRTQK